jgi:hypothetical protein
LKKSNFIYESFLLSCMIARRSEEKNAVRAGDNGSVSLDQHPAIRLLSREGRRSSSATRSYNGQEVVVFFGHHNGFGSHDRADVYDFAVVAPKVLLEKDSHGIELVMSRPNEALLRYYPGLGRITFSRSSLTLRGPMAMQPGCAFDFSDKPTYSTEWRPGTRNPFVETVLDEFLQIYSGPGMPVVAPGTAAGAKRRVYQPR